VTPPASLGMRGSRLTGFSLAAVVAEFENLPRSGPISKTVGFAHAVETDRHRRLAVFVLRQAEPGAHVDHGDDAAAAGEDPGDLGRRQRQPASAVSGMNTSWTRGDRQAEQLAADHGGDVFGHGGPRWYRSWSLSWCIVLKPRLNLFMPRA